MDNIERDLENINREIRRKRENLDREEFELYIERVKEEIEYQSLPREFIKNILDTDVDAFKQTNIYRIYAMYNVVYEDESASIEQILIDEIIYTWKDLELDGGLEIVLGEIKKEYKIKD